MNRIAGYDPRLQEVQVGPVSATERGSNGPGAYCYNLGGVEYWIAASTMTFPLIDEFTLAVMPEPKPSPTNQTEVNAWLQSQLAEGVLQSPRQQGTLASWGTGSVGATFKLEVQSATIGYWTRRLVGSEWQEAAVLLDGYGFPFNTSLDVSMLTPNPISLKGDPETAMKGLLTNWKTYGTLALNPVVGEDAPSNRLRQTPEKLKDLLP